MSEPLFALVFLTVGAIPFVARQIKGLEERLKPVMFPAAFLSGFPLFYLMFGLGIMKDSFVKDLNPLTINLLFAFNLWFPLVMIVWRRYLDGDAGGKVAVGILIVMALSVIFTSLLV